MSYQETVGKSALCNIWRCNPMGTECWKRLWDWANWWGNVQQGNMQKKQYLEYREVSICTVFNLLCQDVLIFKYKLV